MNFSVLVLIVLLTVTFPAIYHIGQNDFEDSFFKVFAQLEGISSHKIYNYLLILGIIKPLQLNQTWKTN